MKKFLIFLIVLLCLSCVNLLAEENVPELEYEKTMSELSDKFTYRTAYILRNDVLAEYKPLNRGEEILILDQDDSFYYIEWNYLNLAIDKNRVRTENEEQFVGYEGYTRDGSGAYSDLDLEEKINTFKLNDKVKVIDSFLGVLLVEYENGKTGYMSPSSVSKTEYSAQTYSQTPSVETDTGSDYYYHSNDDDDDGGTDPAPAPAPAPAPDPGPQPSSGDGEDISLAYFDDGYETVFINDSGFVKAKVLIDNTITYIARFQRGDIVKVLGEEGDFAILLINGRKGKVEKKYIRYDSEKQYESWNGYAISSSCIYKDFDMNEILKLNSANDSIKVIDEVDGMYVVELSDGSIGYMKKSSVSKEEVSTYAAPESSPVPADTSGGSYDHDDGDSDSSPAPDPAPAPAPSPEPAPSEPEWTDPVL